MTKKILDVTCGSRTIWFNKNHPAAIYCDVRDEECTGVWKSTNRDSERTCIVHPDVLCDFTDLPFPDNSFALVVFDPPHLRRVGENAWMRKKYGQLGENWREMLHDGLKSRSTASVKLVTAVPFCVLRSSGSRVSRPMIKILFSMSYLLS